MEDTFDKYVNKMRDEYLPKLKQMMPTKLADLKGAKLPKAGIYVLYEDETPLYVGRTGRMKARLKEHGAQSSSHFSASFAFILAKEKALLNNVDCKRSRKQLQDCPDFAFNEAKGRVSNMRFKCIEINDSIEQTLFEVYAAIELETLHNSFEPH